MKGLITFAIILFMAFFALVGWALYEDYIDKQIPVKGHKGVQNSVQPVWILKHKNHS